MLAASISADDAKKWERKFAGRISIAAFNAPRQVTLAGDAIALTQIAEALKHSKVFCRFLQTEYAFHSQQMDAIWDGLLGDLPRSAGGLAKLPMISTVTGHPVKGPELNADYWWRNVREPVLFSLPASHVCSATAALRWSKLVLIPSWRQPWPRSYSRKNRPY